MSQIVLAALLLAAQHGALTHEVRHLQDRLPVQAQQQDSGKKAAHAGLCPFHISFSEVLGAVSSAKLPLQLAANSVESNTDDLLFACPAKPVVPAARGPPDFL